ncbi:MAG: C25 family cysteine peptidase [Pyrinomonadaceae bacterium]
MVRRPAFSGGTAAIAMAAIVATAVIVPPARVVAFTPNVGLRKTAETAAFEHLVQARATASPRGVLIEWSNGLDAGTLGFNVYRIIDGQRTKLNPGLIAGSALVVRARVQSYSWIDPGGTFDSQYEVESVDLRGDSSDRVFVQSNWSAALPEYRQSELLNNLSRHSTVATTNPDWLEMDRVQPALAAAAGDLTTTTLAQQWLIANQPALKIGVRAQGWYRLTQPQIAAAGFNTAADARNLRLFVEGNEVAISVTRDNGQLSASDFVEFWGQGLDTSTSDTRVYWLINGAQPGKRIEIKGELQTSAAPGPVVSANKTLPTTASLSWFTGVGGAVASLPVVLPAKSGEGVEPLPVNNARNSAAATESFIGPSPPEMKTDKLNQGLNAKAGSDNAPIDPLPSVAATGRAISKIETLALAASGKIRAKNSRPLRSHRRRGRLRRLRRHNHSMLEAVPAFTYSLQYKDKSVYYSAALNGDRENFFGPVVFGDGPVVPLTIHNVETTSTAPAQLQIALQGVSIETHQVRVFVNGSLAGSITFADESSAVQTFSIPNSWLVEGDNAIKLVPVASSHDTSVVDYIRISYAHSFRADGDSLQLSVKSTQDARIDGFTNANIRVLDVTDPNSIQQVRPLMQANGGTFTATVSAVERGKARRLIALPESRISQPAWLALNQPSSLNQSTNRADVVIITYKDFIPSLASLVAQREAQGFTVAVTDVDDVFDEFSYGAHTPQAIRDFMLRAKTTWARGPSYLLLVGDASYDPRNYAGVGNFDLVPSRQIDTGIAGTATALETASDDWLTDFNGDGIADISVGRLPVRTVAEANLVVSKIVNYSPPNAGNRALLVADTQGSYYFNFEAAVDEVGGILPATMTIQKVYRRLQPSDADARSNIISNLNAGQSVTVYSGHGNVNIWGGQIFTANDAAALTNGNRLSFVVVMDCLNGFFADPSLQSVAESLLKAPNGGAVASFASSGLTIPEGQHEMGLKMFQLLYGGSGAPIAIGDASRQAKSATSDIDVRRTWILFGDPTLKIR